MALDKPTRFATDLLESAAVEGARQSRSAKQQLDYWARLGRAVSMHQTAARLRVEAVLAGTTALAELDPTERLVANSEIDVAIQQHAAGGVIRRAPRGGGCHGRGARRRWPARPVPA